MNKKDNPIQVVSIRETDHRPPGPISSNDKIFGDGASRERRAQLAKEVKEVSDYFKLSFNKWPTLPVVAKVTLKEEALAKSHRPTALFSKTTCPIIGTMDYGELLVSATQSGLDALQRRIKNNTAKKQTANISAIEKIEPYIAGEWISRILKNGSKKVKLKLFDHKDQKRNESLEKAFSEFVGNNELNLNRVRYGKQEVLTVDFHKGIEKKLAGFVGLRSAAPMPEYFPLDMNLQVTPIGNANLEHCPAPLVGEDYPVVGVIDSGVCPKCNLLDPWIVARESYVPLGMEDYGHGTMVAGLVVNSHRINHSDPAFPMSQAKIVDVNVFPKNSNVSEEDLVEIIEEVVAKYPSVKVWNLSLGASCPVGCSEFSDFARFLDEMHDEYGCLFVVAAGNQNDAALWPTTSKAPTLNRISSPGDSIRALTVGSIAHKDTPTTLVKMGEPSPFSRIGPGPCFIPKPEVTHYGGNNTAAGSFAQTGVLSMGPKNMIYESIGTSFATPIVSSQAASLLHYLKGHSVDDIPPERIKALVIHTALLANPKVNSDSINGHGFGKPSDIVDMLYCDPHCITLFFETDLKHGGFEFERYPFPIPDCLLTDEGKFKGEIAMTLVYSPITDEDYASEYCRTNVDAGMGSYDKDDEGKRKFHSRVPAAPKDISKLYEKSRIEHGFKWSPVKAYHHIFPQGVSIDTWRLKLKVERRAEEQKPEVPQRVSLVVSLRALDPSQPVYNEAIRKMNQSGWVTHDIDVNVRVGQ